MNSLPPPPAPRESMAALFGPPAARTYLGGGLGSVALLFAVLFQRNSDIGGVFVASLGAAGLVFRWPSAPPLVVAGLCYFLLFPQGVPDVAFSNPFELQESHFRVADLVLAVAVVGYLGCQYRLLGLTRQAVPEDGVSRPPGAPPVRRPAGELPAGELGRFAAVAVAAVVAGQLAWLFLNAVELDPGRFVPLKLAESRGFGRPPPRAFSQPAGRLVLSCGLLAAGTLLASLGFWYWRLRGLRRDEARMLLMDAGWNEGRREYARVETWRARVVKQREGDR